MLEKRNRAYLLVYFTKSGEVPGLQLVVCIEVVAVAHPPAAISRLKDLVECVLPEGTGDEQVEV